ncbi:helix-turn-helix transcriptional regulator [Streptomyces pactum]|uniref:AraC family transcriptional regulator n=1 Tax=Streptomyces pactum TaxID=68249 RepID=A0A1S6J3J9_9ACTN|nr:helix-turn-helix transcriptional regulator [Streptomyces pactum]AQS66336.1 AraC family transcriptional regulator [Streptomyces pactum]
MEHLVQRSIATMHHRFHEPLTLDDLARSAMVSKFYFLRVFSRVTGVTPGRFLSAVRLHEAKRLLRSTSLNVADISARVGYSSTGTFSRRFSESVGVSPTKYRCLAYERHSTGPTAADDLQPTATPHAAAPVTPARQTGANTVHGTIVAEDHPLDSVRLGVFNSPILQGHPVTTAEVSAPGRYFLPELPSGVWYLHAVARSDAAAAVVPPGEPQLLVDMVGPLRFGQNTDLHVNLTLRPFTWSRPPILSALEGLDPLGRVPGRAA